MTAKELGQQPAFPRPKELNGEVFISPPAPGMSIRTWLAGQALAGIHASCSSGYPDADEVAENACEAADALLEKLAEDMK